LLNAHAINSSEFPPIIFASTGPPLTVATLRKKKKKKANLFELKFNLEFVSLKDVKIYFNIIVIDNQILVIFFLIDQILVN
jgi:hypothetical protein